MNEFLNTAKFYAQNNPLGFATFIFHRLRNKIKKRVAPAVAWYPPEIRCLLAHADAMPEIEWKGPVNEISGVNIPEQIQPATIKLASQELDIREGINWDAAFEDSEDFESLHRWNWVLYGDGRRLAGWIEAQLVSWFETKSNLSTNDLRWSSYTVGERICNGILFYTFIQKQPPRAIQEGLQDHVIFLLRHLEYCGSFTGNHVFNNSRAVFMAGCVFNVSIWKEIGGAIILREIKELVTPTGFLREGSSHYHVLFTRWVLEIMDFARRYEEKEVVHQLEPWAKMLKDRCAFFLEMPLIGDISPDFTPSWLMNFPGLVPETPVPDFCSDGWFRTSHEDVTILGRAENINGTPRSSHGHCDLGSFCLYWKGFPILVDSGRLNYGHEGWGRFGLSAQAHNSILIDGHGVNNMIARCYPEVCMDSKTQVSLRGGVTIEFEGFQSLGKMFRISRLITFGNHRLVIEDTIEGSGEHEIALYFHLAPAIELMLEDSRQSFGMNTSVGRWHGMVEGPTARLEKFYGGENPLGWRVTEYGKREPSPTLKVLMRDRLPLRVKTTFQWDI